MKRETAIVFVLVLVLLVSACGKVDVEPVPAPEEQTSEQETEAVQTIADIQIQEQQVDLSDPMNMAATVLNDPQVIFQEDAAMMDENSGANFGNVAIKQLGDDGSYYQFISNSDGAYMISNLNFLDVGEFRGDAQAVMIKFQPKNVNGLSFTIFGNGEIILSFQDNHPYFTHVNDNYTAPYSDYRKTDLTLESDKWYWAIMAFDSEGNYRSLVWEDQNADNNAYCGENMGEWHGEYRGSNWHLTIAFGPDQTLNVQEYYIMDFDGFAGMEYSGGDENQQADNKGGYQDPVEIINEIVMEPQVLYQDDLSSLPDRGYSGYSDVDEKHPGDGFEFITMENSTGFTFLTPLLDVVPEGERKDNFSQAVLINFRTNNPTGLQFNLFSQETPFMTFMNNAEPAFGIIERPEFGMTLFRDVFPTDFVLEADSWYYAFIAININGDMRFKIWQEENPNNSAYYQVHLVEDLVGMEERSIFAEQNWTFEVMMGNNSQFNMKDFKVMDFVEMIDAE